MMSSARPFASIQAGVVYESGDSKTASVGRSTRQMVLPVIGSIFRTYDGSSVFMPCSTCTYSASPWSKGDEAYPQLRPNFP